MMNFLTDTAFDYFFTIPFIVLVPFVLAVATISFIKD